MDIKFTLEEVKVMREFIDSIKEQVSKCPYPMKWFIAVEIPGDIAQYFSNMCPVCAVEDMVDWLEESNMKHLADDKEEEEDKDEDDEDNDKDEKEPKVH